jgi:rare lipoprotein A
MIMRICKLATRFSPTMLMAALGILSLMCGCSKRQVYVNPPLQTGKGQPVESPTGAENPDSVVGREGQGIEMEGIASWYGDPYHGHWTASGEIYDKNKMTAAHRTLPFNTMVLVHNLENGKDVTVRINDRGPFVKDRIIDLSFAAARGIGIVGAGSAHVRIDILENAPVEGYFTIQVGAFRDKERAEAMQTQVAAICSPAHIVSIENDGGVLYRVQAGRYLDHSSALKALAELKKRKYEGFVVRLDR